MTWLPDLTDAALRAAVLGSLFLGGAHLVSLALRRRSAAAQHLGWSAVLLATVLMPFAAMAPWRLAWLPVPSGASRETTRGELVAASPEYAADTTGQACAAEPGTPVVATMKSHSAPVDLGPLPSMADSEPVAFTPVRAREPVLKERSIPSGVVLTWLWALGTALLLARLIQAVVDARRAVARATPATGALATRFEALANECGVASRPRLLVSEGVGQPRTTGLLRPVVIAPAAVDWTTSENSTTALRHELAHVSRRDVLTQVIGHLATALYWWNPLVWSTALAQRRQAELSCDDAVLLSGTNAADYADCLVSAARHSRGRRGALQLAMANPQGLERRIEAALDSRRRRSVVSVAVRRTVWAGTALVGMACASLDARGEPAAAQGSKAVVATATLVVSQDGSADFTSIQAAVDGATEGARIEVRPGRYEENVKLAKKLTLAGSGFESCQIVTEFGADSRPSLSIVAPGDVRITGLKVTSLGATEGGGLRGGAALSIEGGKAHIEGCAILGSPASGVSISGDATVTLTGTLIAGAWADGLVIRQGIEGEGRVLVKDCAIRNNYHNAVSIGGGAPRTRIEGCWIRGAGWHGVRYDGSAPELVGNRFFGNERSGIYASGKTAARIEGNLFIDRGVSCWFENRDTIVGNTFVGDPNGGRYLSAMAAVSIIGQSQPRIERNLITAWPLAVSVGKSSDEGPTNALATEWTVINNVFWKNGHALKVMEENPELDAAAGNVEADPGFADPASGDYRLTENSAARARGAGAKSVLAAASPWALQEEEKPVATGPDSTSARRTRDTIEAKSRKQQMAAASTSKTWVEDALQIRDAALRERSVAAILEALESNDSVQIQAGLTALQQITEVAFDKAPFEEATRRLAGSLEGRAQVQAFYRLLNTRGEKRPEDLELLIGEIEEALKGEEGGVILSSASHLLFSFSERELKGRVADVVLAVFASDKADTRETLGGLWGARVSPELAAHIIQLAEKGSRHRHDALYFGLSTFYDKSPAVLDALFEACEDPDHNNSGRALWGLTNGVPEASYPKVADFLILLFQARSSESIRRDCLQGLRTYASAKHLPELKKLGENELLSQDLRSRIDGIVTRLEAESDK